MSCSSKCKPINLVVNINPHIEGVPMDLREMMIATEDGEKFKKGQEHPECMSCIQQKISASVREMARDELVWLQKTGRFQTLNGDQVADIERRLKWGLD